ncbi:hypothetical protein K439DRAFT_1393827, partial [Ramaria rubella]
MEVLSFKTFYKQYINRILAIAGCSTHSILPFIPRPLKWLFLFILLINSRGLPLTWHIRAFRPAFYFKLYHSLRNLIESPTQRIARFTRHSPVGMDPFTCETVFKTRATPDACDFNMHLSNSSYAMTYDMVRIKYVVEYFPMLYPDGAWMGLGATHYSFIKEIPVNAPYEIRLSIGSWDKKWLYMIARYVTYPSKSQYEKEKPSTPGTPNGTMSYFALTPTVTPASSTAASPSCSPTLERLSAGLPLPRGAVLHCIALSRVCVKMGRITIPPDVAIASTGFAMSHARFSEVQSWRFKDKGKPLRDFYKGGWRKVPEGERWWEDALSGDIEQKRIEGMRELAETSVWCLSSPKG